MNKQKIIKELGKHRGVMTKQTLKTIRGQVIAGDLAGAGKGLDREIRKMEGRRDKDCFAYKNRRSCTALKVKDCDGCEFYKTKEEAEEGRLKAIDRIKTLDKEKRVHINETYYDSKLEV